MSITCFSHMTQLRRRLFAGFSRPVDNASLRRVFVTYISLVLVFIYSSATQAKHLLIFGDSLSAAYGMEWENGWAQLIDQQWQTERTGYKVSNASISGETTVGGLARLPLTLTEIEPDVVILELGANDGLRGYPIEKIKANLLTMVELIQSAAVDVIIGGISLPPSYGPRYIDQFRQLFRDVAKTKNIPYIDFYDETFVTKQGFIQADGLHPTEITQPLIKDRVLSFLKSEGLIE